MALLPQLLPYTFGLGGMDQRADDRLVPLGRAKDLRNIRFPKQGRISRRGQFGTPTGTVSTSVILKRMYAVGDEGLLGYGIDSSGARAWHTYEPTTGTLVNAGTPAVPRAWVKNAPSSHTVTDTTTQMYQCDVAHGTSQACYVALRDYAAFTGVVEWWIVDEKTNRVIASGNTSTAPSVVQITNVRVLAMPGTNTFLIGMGHSISQEVIVHQVSATSARATTGATCNELNASDRWDWAIYDSNLYIVQHRLAPATDIRITKVPVTALTPQSVAYLAVGTAPTALGVIVPYSTTSSTRITVLLAEGTNGLRGVCYNSALAVTTVLWVINATLTTRDYVVGAERSDGTLEVYTQLNNASAHLVHVARHTVTVGAGASSTTTIFGARLASKPVVTTTFNAFVLIGFHSLTSLQPSLFLYEGTKMVARFALGVRVAATGNVLPNLTKYLESGAATTKFYGAALFTSRIFQSQDGSIRETEIAGAWFDTDAAAGLVAIDDEDTKLITGGYLSIFDGNTVDENGFLLAPEIVSATGAAGGSMPISGTYLFKCVFVWTDARGRIHRSEASQPFTGTTSAAQSTVNIVVRAMSFTRHANFYVELYRTTNGGSVYYLADVVLFDQTTSTVTVSATGSDSALVSNTPLPQQGTILANQQPSCPVGIATTGRRVLVTPGDDMSAITEGKERVEGEGTAFFETIERRATKGGDIYALSTAGERWVAFKKRGIYFAAGEGADDSGNGDSLTEFEQFSNDVGCAQPQTIVETTHGIVFRAEQGFYLLARDGGLVYLGAGVETELGAVASGLVITDAAYDKDNGTIHFQTTNQEALVLTMFKTEQGIEWRWSVDDSCDFVGLCFTGGRLWASRATTQTTPLQRYEPTGTYASGSGQTFTMRVRTGWIHLFGPQGRGRLWDILVLGRSSTSAQLTAQIAYDFDETFVQSDVADAALIGNAPYQWQIEPNQQSCEAVMIDLSQNAAVAGGDTELNQIVFELGVQPGRYRVPSNKKAA